MTGPALGHWSPTSQLLSSLHWGSPAGHLLDTLSFFAILSWASVGNSVEQESPEHCVRSLHLATCSCGSGVPCLFLGSLSSSWNESCPSETLIVCCRDRGKVMLSLVEASPPPRTFYSSFWAQIKCCPLRFLFFHICSAI